MSRSSPAAWYLHRPMDPDELLERIRMGDCAAFDALVAELCGPLRRFYSRHGVSATDADDLAQEVFIAILRRLPGREERDSYSAWVWTIVRNTMHDRFRASSRNADLLERYGHVARIPRTTTFTKMERRQREDRLNRAIPKLPTPMRTVILHDLAGGDPRALAQAEGIESVTVRTRRYRAWEWLREDCSDDEKN